MSNASSERLPVAANREWAQRPTAKYSERKSKFNLSIGSFLSEIKEPQGRGPWKILGVRGGGGHQENMTIESAKRVSHELRETEAANMGLHGSAQVLCMYIHFIDVQIMFITDSVCLLLGNLSSYCVALSSMDMRACPFFYCIFSCPI